MAMNHDNSDFQCWVCPDLCIFLPNDKDYICIKAAVIFCSSGFHANIAKKTNYQEKSQLAFDWFRLTFTSLQSY